MPYLFLLNYFTFFCGIVVIPNLKPQTVFYLTEKQNIYSAIYVNLYYLFLVNEGMRFYKLSHFIVKETNLYYVNWLC